MRKRGHNEGSIQKAGKRYRVFITVGYDADGKQVRMILPALSQERRQQLVHKVKETSEHTRVSLRNLRRDAADQLKKEEHDGTIGADELRREMEQLQRVTDKHVADVDHVGAAKEQEILEV